MNRREEAQLGYIPENENQDEGNTPDVWKMTRDYLGIVRFMKENLFHIGFKEETSQSALIKNFFDSMR